jgi:hypothetical protein
MDAITNIPPVVVAVQLRRKSQPTTTTTTKTTPTTATTTTPAKWTMHQLRSAWREEFKNPIQGSQWGQLLPWLVIAPGQNMRELQLPLDSCLDLSQLNLENLDSAWLAYWKEHLQCRVAAIRVSSQRCTLPDLMRLLRVSWLDYLEIDTTEAAAAVNGVDDDDAAVGRINGMFQPTCQKVLEWENSGLIRYNKHISN